MPGVFLSYLCLELLTSADVDTRRAAVVQFNKVFCWARSGNPDGGCTSLFPSCPPSLLPLLSFPPLPSPFPPFPLLPSPMLPSHLPHKENRWRKRGMSVVPLKYGLDLAEQPFTVFVSIYSDDGTVAIAHAGVEIGQGINIKVSGRG